MKNLFMKSVKYWDKLLRKVFEFLSLLVCGCGIKGKGLAMRLRLD